MDARPFAFNELWCDWIDHPDHCQRAEDQDDNRRASNDVTRLPFIGQIQRRIDSLRPPNADPQTT